MDHVYNFAILLALMHKFQECSYIIYFDGMHICLVCCLPYVSIVCLSLSLSLSSSSSICFEITIDDLLIIDIL